MSAGRPGRIALWGAVGVLVASAHVAGAAWMMRTHDPALPPAPEAIEIELAPAEPLAELAPEPAELEAESEPEPETAEAPEPEPVLELPPLEPLPPPDLASLVPETVPDFVAPPLLRLPPPDFASLTAPRRPQRRPDRIAQMQPEEPPEPVREKPEAEKPKAKKPKAEKSKAEAPKTGKPPAEEQEAATQQGQGRPKAANGAVAGRASPAAAASWQKLAGARVSAHMSRARASGASGTVRAVVVVSVKPSGATSARLAQGTGDARIDAALSRQAARMPRLPPPPDGRAFQFQQPIAIRVR